MSVFLVRMKVVVVKCNNNRFVHTMVCEDSGMFYLNSARESSEHYVILRITPIKLSLMRPRRNYGKYLHHTVV